VKYVNYRSSIGSWLVELSSKMILIEKGELKVDDIGIKIISHYINTLGMFKHSSWKYEKEYRVVLPYENSSLNSGMLTPFDGIVIKVKRVIIGFACNPQYESIIRDIANKLEVECVKALIDNYSEKYNFIYK